MNFYEKRRMINERLDQCSKERLIDCLGWVACIVMETPSHFSLADDNSAEGIVSTIHTILMDFKILEAKDKP